MATGCEREPLPLLCPDLQPGDLVLSEVRGNQSGGDKYDQWLELYNASGSTIALEGVHINMIQLDGDGPQDITIRSPELTVEAGDYVVLGRYGWLDAVYRQDYGYRSDLDSNLHQDAAVTISSCGTVIDQAVYKDLPSAGTRIVDGASVPDASRNDLDSPAWCIDPIGTPGAANLECP